VPPSVLRTIHGCKLTEEFDFSVGERFETLALLFLEEHHEFLSWSISLSVWEPGNPSLEQFRQNPRWCRREHGIIRVVPPGTKLTVIGFDYSWPADAFPIVRLDGEKKRIWAGSLCEYGDGYRPLYRYDRRLFRRTDSREEAQGHDAGQGSAK
jgi:hypothetical protein